MNKLWISALILLCVFADQEFYPRRITYCQEGWYPDPIVTSQANGDAASVTYTFFFALEGYDASTTTVNVQFPSDFSVSGYYTLSAMKLEDTENCYCASRTVTKNLAALTATGPFSLWSNLHGSQPTYLGWNFASIGFGPAIATMTNLVARFKTGLDSTGTSEDSTTKENLILQSSTVEVQLTLSKPVYQGDIFVLTFPDKFDLSKVTEVKSVILGKGTSFENLQWTKNKITSDEPIDSNSYKMKYTITNCTITIYSFNNNIDPRNGQANDKYAVFQISGVINPNAKYIKTSLSFSASTQRYTYSFGPCLMYETKSVTFSDDLKTGSVPSAKCDFSNSAKYGSTYIQSKKVAVSTLIFVDFTFTLDHPVIEGGKIVVVLDGMETPTGAGSFSSIYVSKGLTPSSSTMSATWDAADTVKITGYKSTSVGPTVTFTAQVKVVSGDCFKSVTSYAADQATKIDEKTSISVSSAVTSDSTKALFGGTSFNWEFFEGGQAGTSTSFKLSTSTSHATLIVPNTDNTKTDETVVILNTDATMYTFGSSLFTTDTDHLNYAPSTYRNATSTSNSNGVITIRRENKNKDNSAWTTYFISDLANVNDPQTSYVKSAVPYYPAYLPNMHKYEVCVFQKDPDQTLYKNMNCLYKDVAPTTQGNDGDQRCIEECFSLKSCANQHEATWDFLIWHVRIPTKDSSDEFETGKLVWTFQVPASDSGNKVVGTFACDSASTYFSDGTYGLASGDAADYPLSIATVGSMSSSYESEPILSVTGYVGTIEYSALYEPSTGATQNDYWGVFPVKSKSQATHQDALSCTITFTWTDSTGYSRTILTLGHTSAAGSTNNGPMYIWESSNPRDYYYRDKFRMNWQMSDWEFDHGAKQSIVAQQRMIYGMGANSWCMVLLPSYFDYIDGESEVVTSASGGNLTFLELWEFNDKQFLLTYHDEDVWPEWTNNIEVSNLQAPWGEQTKSLLDDDGFRLYMACGNEGDEGEATQTWNSLMITPFKKGYESGSWKETSVTERTIRDFSATFTLEDTHTLGENCYITFEWENSYFLPSWIEVDSVLCSQPATNINSATCYLTRDITSSLVISFRDTLVVKSVNEDADNYEDTAYFLKSVNAFGTWGAGKRVYECKNLNQGTDDCGNVDSGDFKITVKGQSNRYVTVNEISLFPNNLKPQTYDWIFSDARIIFYVKNQLLYSNKQGTTSQKPRIQLNIPSDFVLNSNFDANDNCYLNFTGTCSVSSTTVTIYPSETIRSNTNYMVWLIQAIKAPIKAEATEAQAWGGQTFFHNLVVDDEREASKDINDTMYATLYNAAIAGTNDLTSLRVFPSNKGEYAQYTFKLQWTDNSGSSEPLRAGRQIWIQFPATQYDYFVGDATEWFQGYVDEDDESPIYYIPCLLSTNSVYMAGVDCVAKRNWLFVTVTQDVDVSTVLELQVVGIRNPDTTTEQVFYLLVMEADTEEYDDYHCKADQYYSCAYTFKDEPAAMIDFLNVTIDYEETSNALGGTDNYEFWFTVFNEGTTVKTITMKAVTSKFILTFPEDYSFHPTLSAVDDPNLKSFSGELYRVISMADYAGLDPYNTISNEPQANYTLHQWGNALQWSSTEEITFPSNKDETTFYDYVFTLQQIQNPSYAHMRMDESYDNAYPDDTKLDLSDNLWTSYEEYSKKFELAILNEENAQNSDSIFYQTRSYGILHHSYIGFFEINPLLYILDQNFMQAMELEATAGLLSEYYYIATGSSKGEATNHPLSFDSIKVSSGSEVVQFKPDKDGLAQQTLYEFGWSLPFKLAADQEEGGTIKFINWNQLEQSTTDSAEKYAEMADTLVYVYEPDEETYAQAELAVGELDIFEGIASLPIQVYLTQSPSTDVKIKFSLVFNEDENKGQDSSKLNDDSVVKMEPSELLFETWDENGNFTVKVEGWDFTKGSSFRLYIGYDGTNANSYTDSDQNYIKLNVQSTNNEVTPTVEFDAATLVTDTYSFSVEVKVNQMGYAQWLVLPEGQVGPETGELLADWSEENYKRIRLLQDNTTEEEEEEEEFEYGEATDVEVNEWENEINDDKATHMQSEFLLSELLVVYDSSANVEYSWDNDVDGSFLWGNLEYVIYTTFLTIGGQYSVVASLSFTTGELPAPEWASATVSGSSQPDSSSTYDIVCSFAKSINWRCEQLIYSSEWVFESTRRARSLASTDYEACTQLVSDPSGTSTQKPDQILLAATTCSNCEYYFDQYFKGTSAGSLYAAVGFNVDQTSNAVKSMSSLSSTTPIANLLDSNPESNSYTLTFEGYEDHYLYSVLLNEAPSETLETITSDQIISGLDYENQEALNDQALTWPKGPTSSVSDEKVQMDLTYDNLKSGTTYAVCVVAVNSYTSITNPLTNFGTTGLQKCYTITTSGPHQEEEEDCEKTNTCNEDGGDKNDDSGYELLMSVFLAVLALLLG